MRSVQKDLELWRNLRYDDPPVQLEQSMIRESYGICAQRCHSGEHSKACPETARRVWLSCAVDHLADTANLSAKCNSLHDQPRGRTPSRSRSDSWLPAPSSPPIKLAKLPYVPVTRGRRWSNDEISTKSPHIQFSHKAPNQSMRLTPITMRKRQMGIILGKPPERS